MYKQYLNTDYNKDLWAFYSVYTSCEYVAAVQFWKLSRV